MTAPTMKDSDASSRKRRRTLGAPPGPMTKTSSLGLVSRGSGDWWTRVKRLGRSKPPAPTLVREDGGRQQSQRALCDSAQAKTNNGNFAPPKNFLETMSKEVYLPAIISREPQTGANPAKGTKTKPVVVSWVSRTLQRPSTFS